VILIAPRVKTRTQVATKSMGIRNWSCNKTEGAPHPRFPEKTSGFREPHAPFLKERRTRSPVQGRVQEIRGISLVLREMWDTTAFNLRALEPNGIVGGNRRVPHVRQSVRGTKTMGEAQQSLSLNRPAYFRPQTIPKWKDSKSGSTSAQTPRDPATARPP
jgi:hypothetical protein